jgi:hypothetical protein
MMRRLLVPAALAAALLVPSAAVAGDHDGTVTPTPLPTRVTDEASAETFAQAYVIRNGARIAGVVNQFNGRDDFNGRDNRSRNRTRVTVSDAASACLQHPVIAARFGCIVRFNVAVNEERSYARLGPGPRQPSSAACGARPQHRLPRRAAYQRRPVGHSVGLGRVR